MKFWTTAAMALVLAAGAGSALADPPNDNNNNDNNGHNNNTGTHNTNTTTGHNTGTNTGGHGPPTTGAPHTATTTTTTTTTHTTNTNTNTGGPSGPPHMLTWPHTTTPPPGPTGGQNHVTTPNNATNHNNTNGNHAGLPNVFNPAAGHNLRTRDNGRPQYTSQAFPQIFRTTRRFHVAPRPQPRGWYYRSWTYGQFLPLAWLLPTYYLNWGAYGLPEPPIGCEWVQEGPDALLIDVWTGEVLSVYRGVFY
jgi:Ni/Co efflux regulator RcnB